MRDARDPHRKTMIDLYAGLMSGTSLDGVDAVLADFGTFPPRVKATCFLPYPRHLSARLLSLQDKGGNEMHLAALIGNELADLYHQTIAGLLEKARVNAKAVRAIGCHGQTVRHNPRDGYSLQLGNPAMLAELSEITVVADFRSRDIAAGGQGAPLVPAFHEAVFRSTEAHRIILNVGGIANVTSLKPGSSTIGFDTGPGNMLLDAWTQRNTGESFDAEGRWASGGHLIPALLDALLAHPYFSMDPPKSCGRDQFNIDWLEANLSGGESAQDVQSTLLELSAISIISAIDSWCGKPDELIVCGGGAHNAALMKRLSMLLQKTRVATSDMLGIGVDWVEALAFAWLARQTIQGLPGNLPTVTGARGERILGAIYPS